MSLAAATPLAPAPLLTARRLRVEAPGRGGRVGHLVGGLPGEGLDLDLAEGEVLGIVGESGAGKSLAAHAMLGLLRPPLRLAEGEARLAGEAMTNVPPRALAAILGRRVGLIVQNPQAALDPLARVGAQLTRMLELHGVARGREARQRARQLLADVGIADPDRRLAAWPHELSGGMAQRVMIALALANRPRLLVADEPTTGLDLTVQAQILALIGEQVRARAMAALLITHDFGVVARYADRVAVMFAGRIVESGPVARVLVQPRHPYTRHLVALSAAAARAAPAASGAPDQAAAPDPFALDHGCAYRARCPVATPLCAAPPPLQPSDGVLLCHVPQA
jgi:oligopeptide/dipeptide ABC transporter ATP-binding protein